MTDSTRSRYTVFCENAADLPVFFQPWYLDAVCNDSWEVVMIEKNNQILAVLPYFLKSKWQQQYVAMPPLCKMLGPYILQEFRNTKNEIEFYKKLITALPPNLKGFEQDCNYTFQNWLPFFWVGFRQTTRYSYQLNINDLAVTYQNFYPDFKNQKIPKAATATQIQIIQAHENSGDLLAVFFDIHHKSFVRQNLPEPFSFSFLKNLDAALSKNQARAIFFAKDRSNNTIHSVAYLIWDKTTAWYLLAGDDPELRQSGAGILVAWEAMRFTRNQLNINQFDFAGSMIPSVERVRRQFGATPKPYFRIAKEWSPLWRWGKFFFRK